MTFLLQVRNRRCSGGNWRILTTGVAGDLVGSRVKVACSPSANVGFLKTKFILLGVNWQLQITYV